MAVDWTPELEAKVHERLHAMHHAMAGERSRGDAWAAMLGVRPGAGFSRFMVNALAAAGTQARMLAEPGDEEMASVSAGLSHGIGVAVAMAHALAEDDLT
jgi:hypothetical protein